MTNSYSNHQLNINSSRRPEQLVAVRPRKTKRRQIRLLTLVYLIIGVFLVSICLNLVNRSQVSADVPFHVIYSPEPGYCLDDYHGQLQANYPLDVWYCNGTKSQNFEWLNQQLRLYGTNYCLSINNTNVVVLNSCLTNQKTEDWQRYDVGIANQANQLCLTDDNINGGDHTELKLTACGNMTNLAKQFTYSSWHNQNILASSMPVCQTIANNGQRIACYANQQWILWQSEPKLRPILLNNYTDGNSYEEWCADFVSYIYKLAGLPFNTGERGYNNWDEYDANNLINTNGLVYHQAGSGYTPQAGDIAYFNYPGGHVEIVEKGGVHPIYIYGDSGMIDPISHNGDMSENSISNDGSFGQVVYYLSPR